MRRNFILTKRVVSFKSIQKHWTFFGKSFWKKLWSCCQIFLFLKFLPQHGLRGNFILTEGKVSFKKHWDSKWVGLCFLCSRTDVFWKLISKTKTFELFWKKFLEKVVKLLSNISLLKISSPTWFEGKFYSDRRESFF